jgi:hypothetical protein
MGIDMNGRTKYLQMGRTLSEFVCPGTVESNVQ